VSSARPALLPRRRAIVPCRFGRLGLTQPGLAGGGEREGGCGVGEARGGRARGRGGGGGGGEGEGAVGEADIAEPAGACANRGCSVLGSPFSSRFWSWSGFHALLIGDECSAS
jgi:hypothetical protein